jgi:hypothetical protein
MIRTFFPKNTLTRFLFKLNDDINEESYNFKIQNLERNCEKSLIETLARLNIKAIVKTDPYSLPYNKEIVVTLHGESYLNGAFEFFRVARKIVKELLNQDIYKTRFYLFIDIKDGGIFGSVEYKFRYYEKE